MGKQKPAGKSPLTSKMFNKKINTFGAKNAAELKNKIDSTRQASIDNGLKSHYAFTSGADGTQEGADRANKRSMYYDRLASDADYAADRMTKSLKKMVAKESEDAALKYMSQRSIAHSDATRVVRNSRIPLAPTQFND